WIRESEKAFALARVSDDKKTEYASYYLKNEANFWWESVRAMEPEGIITWDRFKELFKEKYLPAYVTDQMEMRFLELKQGNMSVADYEAKFTELSRFVPSYVDTERKKARRFQQGLKSWIRSKLAILELDTYAAVIQKAMIAEAEGDLYQKEKEGRKRKPDSFRSQGQGSFQGNQNKKPGFQVSRNSNFKKLEIGNSGNASNTGTPGVVIRPQLTNQ
ncbi:hypothetical protein AXD71_14915, partial [Listeria monocytogenes]|uniref:retrotransposon gag family protein n=1 Tax=Listeria monocytogenes TaxID=1639 RepID=UPI00095CA72E